MRGSKSDSPHHIFIGSRVGGFPGSQANRSLRRRRPPKHSSIHAVAVQEHRHIGLAYDGTKRPHSGQYRVLGARKSLLLARARRRIREATAALHVHDGTVVRPVRTVPPHTIHADHADAAAAQPSAAIPSLAFLHCSMSIKSSWKK